MFTVREKNSLIAAELRNESGTRFELLDNGALFAIRHGDILINGLLGHPLEGGVGNLYLRLREGETLYVRYGDVPALALAVLSLAAGWLVERKRWLTPSAPSSS